MTQPLVSVILTYYNHARYIAQAVESVLNQTYTSLELFLINDESPDTPAFEKAIQPFLADPRLHVITHSNRGVAASRNAGLALSSGEYLCLLDSDDWLHSEKLARQVAVLEAAPDLGMVYCDIQLVTENGEPFETQSMPKRAYGPLEPNIFEALWVAGFFEPSTPLLRREWYEKSGPFTVGIEGHSDYEFWLRLSGLGCTVQYMPERLVFYRTHQENFSKKTALMKASRLKARQIIIEKFPDLVAAQDDQVRSKLDKYELYSLHETIKHQEQQLAESENTNRQLNELLLKYSQDLNSLQQTRTVRFSTWVGRLVSKFRRDKDV